MMCDVCACGRMSGIGMRCVGDEWDRCVGG